MPAGAAFLSALAKGLIESLGDDLANALVLLPTRRAARELASAFVAASPSGVTMLPLMRTLADMDENEPPFILSETDIDLPPAMNSVRRRFMLAALTAAKIQASGETLDASAALALADPLQSILSDMAMEELNADVLSALDDGLALAPAHFEGQATFLKIVTEHWPSMLAAENSSEPMQRRVALLDAAARLWQDMPPRHPVIVAGTTGSLAATARLISTIARLPKGAVVLPGLDQNIDDKVWRAIDEQHPQASLRSLLGTIGINRSDVKDWPWVEQSRASRMRRRILAESLIPADETSDWPARIEAIVNADSKDGGVEEGLEGLSLIQASTDEEEAGTISLIMREVLETPGKTCALITPDPSLARRVRSKLSRWQISVDSSAGEPLEETSHGSFLSLIVDGALDPFDPVTLADIARHPLSNLSAAQRADWADFEMKALRGVRPKTVADIEGRLKGEAHSGFDIWQKLQSALTPLSEAFSQGRDLMPADIAVAHTIALEDIGNGAQLWRDEAGEKAANLLSSLIEHGEILPPLSGISYKRLMSTLMRGEVVRPRYGTESRLRILGPLEARMIDADLIVLGGLNEGVWPAPPSPHPFLSRGMRIKVGLSAPERRFGLSAHDFATLAAKPNVILTRAQRTSDGPAVMSRWLWRLTTLARGALGDKVDMALEAPMPYLQWARAVDQAPDELDIAAAPEPKPPLETRWPKGKKQLSVTQISKWIRDPYSIYVDKILRLRSLDPLDQPLGGREYGNAIHRALELFAKGHSKTSGALMALFEKEFVDAGYEEFSLSRYRPRLQAMADWFSNWARMRRADGYKLVFVEEKARWQVRKNDEHIFTLTGIPDRVEAGPDGLSVIDFKTGTIPSAKMIEAGFDPQLPLLAAMLQAGAFGQAAEVSEMLYIKPNTDLDKNKIKSALNKKTPDEQITDTIAELAQLIEHFDNPDSAYYSQPRAQYTNPYGDYDHLARRAEWARLGKEGQPDSDGGGHVK